MRAMYLLHRSVMYATAMPRVCLSITIQIWVWT